ncbi:hypothetical protein [Prescottella agglutinans]|uniref:Uncharacterized protein n=1 Tax=Prescottella agglutinans TaxID=1644129 RepID=A0ABT6MF65_9NOCA|nr:hypothetical protein [Prescottella agglutinans]MDH6282922.1 hypothetical protein [Prescottella agglutinans]
MTEGEHVRPFDFEFEDMERPGVPTHIIVHGQRFLLRAFEAVYPDQYGWVDVREYQPYPNVTFQFEAVHIPPPAKPAPTRRTQLDLGLRRPTA